MKVIFDQKEIDVIYIDAVTNNHLIVAIISGDPCILLEDDNHLSFGIISNLHGSNLTSGNGYDITGKISSVKEMIREAMKTWPTCKIGVFEQGNWKSALQFLIDNA